jgi:hypothetical protein
MSLQDFERETAINWDDSTKSALFYTCNRSLMTKLNKLVESYPDTYKVKRIIYDEFEVCGKEYILPKKLISIRTPSTRVMSEENRQAASERFKKMHEEKNK